MIASTLPASLAFNDIQLRIIDRNGKPWLTAADLARALGYSRSDKVSHLYERNKDEFTEDMTLNLKLGVKGFGNGNSKKDTRIFSSRGCHLVAMLAKTPVAKQFRKWVLDVLEGLDAPHQEVMALEQPIQAPLIQICTAFIGRPNTPAINAQDLHEYLGVGTRYSDWFARRVRHFKLEEDVDYAPDRRLVRHSTGTSRACVHFITLDTATRLAGYECSEQGRMAKAYFEGSTTDRSVQVENPVSPLDFIASNFTGRIVIGIGGGKVATAQFLDGDAFACSADRLPDLIADPSVVRPDLLPRIMEAVAKRIR